MTIQDALLRSDHLKSNTYDRYTQIRWLSQLESMVKQFVIDNYDNDTTVSFKSFDQDTPLATVLFMPEPFDVAYLYWLEAQVHYYNEDLDRYNVAITMFNTTFDEYKNYYKRTHNTKITGRFRF